MPSAAEAAQSSQDRAADRLTRLVQLVNELYEARGVQPLRGVMAVALMQQMMDAGGQIDV